MKKLLMFMSFALLGCGPISNQDSQTEEFKGTGKHIISGVDVNVRNDDLSQVLFTVSNGTTLTPTGATKPGLGYTFYQVKFEDGRKGWIADANWVQPATVTDTNTATGAPRIVVNVSTNRLSFYKGSTLVRSWNVGTARAGKTTPVGNYTVRIKERCPVYRGAEGDKNVAGCSSANPLGTRALWFIDTMYGLHGTSQPGLIAEGTSAADRRLSAGCIRNNNANIEWLFDQVKIGTPIEIVK